MTDEREYGLSWMLVCWLCWLFLQPFALVVWCAPGPAVNVTESK